MKRNQSVAVPGDDQFHILRMTVKGTGMLDRTVSVYFDEVAVPVILIPGAANSASGIDGFVFGAGSTPGQIDMAVDWLTATDAGAFAPGEEYDCLGRSLVVDACPMPFADADEDGDVDMDDFAAFQRCYTSSTPGAYDAENCRCYDRDHDAAVDEFDFLEFAQCTSGPEVMWTQASTPFCKP